MSDDINDNLDVHSERNLNTDLSEMTPEQALKYVTGFIANIKELENKLVQFAKDKSMWSDRLDLAQKNNRQDLVNIASEELKKFGEKEIKYKEEINSLKLKVDLLKDSFNKLICTYKNEVELDKANILLEQLKSITNDDNPQSNEVFKNMNIDDELNKIKNDLR
jgi:hypothetical protein